MYELIFFIIGCLLGGISGVVLMCLLQIVFGKMKVLQKVSKKLAPQMA